MVMQTACGCFMIRRNLLPCQFPPCSCERCQLRREDDNRDSYKSITDYVCPSSGNVASSLDVTEGGRNFHPSSIFSVLFDFIGIIAFIIMTTFTFWLMVSYNLWQFTVKIYHGRRKYQMFFVILLSLLVLCIVLHAKNGSKIKSLQEENVNKDDSLRVPCTPGSLKTLNKCGSKSGLKNPKACKAKLSKNNNCSRQKSSPIYSRGSEHKVNASSTGDGQIPRERGGEEASKDSVISKVNKETQHQSLRKRGGAEAAKLSKKCGKLPGRYSFFSLKDNSKCHSDQVESKNRARDSLCKLCAKTFKKDKDSQRHSPRERGGAETAHLCKGCGKLRGIYSFSKAKEISEWSSDRNVCTKKASDSLCDLCSKLCKKSCSEHTSGIIEYEARRILQKYKLYSIPTEWKSPPAGIVLLMDYLKNWFTGSDSESSSSVL